MTLGGVGMYVMSVALPAVQAEFGTARAGASLPYTVTMIGFGLGGILMGRLSDRFGVMVPTMIGGVCLGAGFVLAGNASSLWQFSLAQFTLAHGFLIGFLGCSATFALLVADTSLWFNRHRGIAVAICASGNYLAGAVWPPILQYFFETSGWRSTYIGVGVFVTAAILMLSLVLLRRPPLPDTPPRGAAAAPEIGRPLGLSPNALMVLLAIAGVALTGATSGCAHRSTAAMPSAAVRSESAIPTGSWRGTRCRHVRVAG